MTPTPPVGLMEAFWEYERALMADDVAALDRLFAPGPTTMRGDVNGLLVGHDAIAAFRGSRGGAPLRRVVETHVQTVDDDHALVVAVTELVRGGRGQQTQLWERQERGWVVTAAHVAVAAPAFDPRVWRVVGAPLAPPTSSDGPLAGETVAVKDLYAVAGQVVGAGNPAYEAAATVELVDAVAVAALRAAGAAVTGLSRTDEFAYSLAGTNAHFGTPPNPKAPRRISGGSSSGSVAAVALGHVSIGLGTDTGGSIRVPAAYNGVWGIRTTHGAVSREGLLPLAETFDTVGWFAREAALLERVGDVLLPVSAPRPVDDVVVVPELLALATPDVTAPVAVLAGTLGARTETWAPDLPAWRAAFTAWQAYEAWQAWGRWLTGRLDTLGADVRGRFEMASGVSLEQAEQARADVLAARSEIRGWLGDRVLVLPSASSVAPLVGGDLDTIREATLQLTCLAGIGGLPAVNVPLVTEDGLPAGACLVAAPGRDRDLLAFASSHA